MGSGVQHYRGIPEMILKENDWSKERKRQKQFLKKCLHCFYFLTPGFEPNPSLLVLRMFPGAKVSWFKWLRLCGSQKAKTVHQSPKKCEEGEPKTWRFYEKNIENPQKNIEKYF